MSENTMATVGKPKVGGAVHRAPLGTTLPTNATSALGTQFVSMGAISEDGLTNENTRESEEIKDWGGNTVLTPQTSKTDKFSMSFIDSKDVNVLKAIYGDGNVTGDLDTGITVNVNATELEAAAWVIDMVTTNGDPKRICIPNGTVSEVGEITYSNGDVVKFETTITCLPDSKENTHYEYLQKKQE